MNFGRSRVRMAGARRGERQDVGLNSARDREGEQEEFGGGGEGILE